MSINETGDWFRYISHSKFNGPSSMFGNTPFFGFCYILPNVVSLVKFFVKNSDATGFPMFIPANLVTNMKH